MRYAPLIPSTASAGLPDVKRCLRCTETKPLRAFTTSRFVTDGRVNICRKCLIEQTRALKAAGPEGERELARRLSLRRTYGMELEQFDALVAAQDGECAICRKRAGSRIDGWIALVVDHSHRTGAIRGLLCSPCNIRLGVYEDNRWNIDARRYLRRAGCTVDGEPA